MEGHHITRDELARRFNHHPPRTSEVGERHEQVREVLFDAANDVVRLTGTPSPEQSTAIRKLEEAMFWANAAIARDGSNVSGVGANG